METGILSQIFLTVGTVALVLLVVFLCVVLFYTISILRIIYEVVILARKKADGFAIKADDIKKYVGGSTVIRLLMLFFSARKKR